MIKIAIIGCGSAVKQLHLPAITGNSRIRATWAVDSNQVLVNKAAKAYGIEHISTDYREVKDVDAALIATPHFLHVPMAEHFLKAGVHVLCEKPLALHSQDSVRLVDLAACNNLVLAVGVFRRYYPTSRLVRDALAGKWLGSVERIDAEEGGQYDWELQSRFMMERDKSGGGVLVDTGSHVLDRILWWFDSCRAQLEEYRDNSMGGVESDCEVKFTVPWNGVNVPVRVELSRTRTLRNTFQLVMTKGMIEIPANIPEQAWLLDRDIGRVSEEFHKISLDLRSGPEARSPMAFFADQINDFCCAIQNNREPVNSGASVVPVVALIESCYQNRIPMDETWVRAGLEKAYLGMEYRA